ncbi:unnamed protein product, partial [Ectocarpus sp. 12 AP-2014]
MEFARGRAEALMTSSRMERVWNDPLARGLQTAGERRRSMKPRTA